MIQFIFHKWWKDAERFGAHGWSTWLEQLWCSYYLRSYHIYVIACSVLCVYMLIHKLKWYRIFRYYFHVFVTDSLCKKSLCIYDKSSHLEVFYEKDVLKNFAKFTGKQLCLRPATSWKKRFWHKCFPVNIAKFLGAPFFMVPLAASFISFYWLNLSLICKQYLDNDLKV